MDGSTDTAIRAGQSAPLEEPEIIIENYYGRVRLPRKGLEKGDDVITGTTQKSQPLRQSKCKDSAQKDEVHDDVGNFSCLSVAPKCQRFPRYGSIRRLHFARGQNGKKTGSSHDQKWQGFSWKVHFLQG